MYLESYVSKSLILAHERECAIHFIQFAISFNQY